MDPRRVLGENVPEQRGYSEQISPPHAAGRMAKFLKPLEAKLTRKVSAFFRANKIIEEAAHAPKERLWQQTPRPRHPFLLSRLAHADQHNIWTLLKQIARERLLFSRREVPRRNQHNPERWNRFGQPLACSHRDILLGPNNSDSQVAISQLLAKIKDKIFGSDLRKPTAS